jgi:phage gp36-like protein
MPYASEADLDTKWGAEAVSLAGFDPASQLRSQAKIDAALCSASALMDGYFCKRYALPIDAAPSGLALLRDICCDLAMGELSVLPGTRNDIVKDAVDNRRKFLELVARGLADIPQNPPPGAPASALPTPNEPIVVDDPRMFDRRSLRAL